MEDEAIRALGWKIRRNGRNICATSFNVFSSLIMVILFLWIMWSGSVVADKPSINREYNNLAFYVGVLIIVLGFLFLLVGFPILADLFIELSEQLQKQEESSIHQAGKSKIICIIGRIFVTVITMVMLAWAIYTGFKIATEPRRGGKYYPLASPVGVVSIMFGFIYFIIGLGIIAELAVELTKQLQRKEKKEIVLHQVRSIDVKCFV